MSSFTDPCVHAQDMANAIISGQIETMDRLYDMISARQKYDSLEVVADEISQGG